MELITGQAQRAPEPVGCRQKVIVTFLSLFKCEKSCLKVMK
jgi:hypothetical protein